MLRMKSLTLAALDGHELIEGTTWVIRSTRLDAHLADLASRRRRIQKEIRPHDGCLHHL